MIGSKSLHQYKVKNQSGFTIPEVILAMVLSSITIAGLYQIFLSQNHHYIAQDISIKTQQNLRSGLFMLTRDIQSARFNPNSISAPRVGFVTNFLGASRFGNILPEDIETISELNIFNDTYGIDINYSTDTDRIAFYSDKNANNDIELDNNDPNFLEGDQGEFVAYRLSGTNLQRFNSELFAVNLEVSEGWQTIATGVDALNFILLDSAGNRTLNPSEANSVELALIIRSSQPDPDYTDTHVYKNYQGDDICSSCTGNHHRRRLMRTTIRIRNAELTDN